MADPLIQIISLAVFVFGVLFGEAVAYRAFGRPKKVIVILDMLLFVFFVYGIYSYMQFSEADIYFYAANFVTGLIAIIVIRAFEAAVGMTERANSTENIADKLLPVLIDTGMEKDAITDTLKKLGVPQKKLDKIAGKIEKHIPAYLPKVVRIYDELADMRAQLASINSMLSDNKKANPSSKFAATKPAKSHTVKTTMQAAQSTEQAGQINKSSYAALSENEIPPGIRHIIQAALERAEKEKNAPAREQIQQTEPAQTSSSDVQPTHVEIPHKPTKKHFRKLHSKKSLKKSKHIIHTKIRIKRNRSKSRTNRSHPKRIFGIRLLPKIKMPKRSIHKRTKFRKKSVKAKPHTKRTIQTQRIIKHHPMRIRHTKRR